MEDMEIPDEYRLGKEGEGLTVFLHALAISRASIGVCLLGLSQRMLELMPCQGKGQGDIWKIVDSASGSPADAGRYGHTGSRTASAGT